MSWYAAHIVQVFRLTQHEQKAWSAWENIVLIEADSSEQAWERAKEYGRQDTPDDESWTLGGKPAVLEFAGVRKVVECVDPDERPGDGTEVSYTDLEFSSREDLDRFVRGDDVTVLVCDGLRDDEASDEVTKSV
jgi:hypothetical protein